MATAEEIIVKLTAQNDALKAGMAEGAATVQAGTDAMAASLKNATASFAAFDAIQKTNLATAAQVAEAQRTINEVQATGAFTSEELAAKQALVDAAMLKVGKTTQEASGFLGLFTRNSRTMYSTSALITDAMTGQFSRMRREVAALGNETGLMAKAFQLVASPIGVATLAVVGFGAAMVEAADRFGRFEQTIESTGNIIGMTAGQLQAMADDVGNVTGASFDAVEAVNSIGRSGLFTGEQLRTAAEAAVYFSQVTGENMDKAASVIEQLQDKPKEAIVKLNDQYHFLTQSQAELVVQLLNTGEGAKAAAVAVQAFHDAMADRAQQMLDNTTALARDWRDVKQWTEGSVEALAEYLNMLGGSKDTTDQLNRAYIQLANDQSSLFKLAHPFTSQSDAIKQDMAVIDQLRDKQAQQEAQAQKTAAANKAAAETLDKGVKGRRGGSDMSGLEQQFQEQEAAAHASYDQMKIDAADFWNAQATNSKNSAAVQADAWQKYIDARHQLDEQGLRSESEAERKGAEAARKAAQERAQIERGVERDRANSMQELQQEIKQASDQEIALARQTAQQKEKLALDDVATARARHQLEFQQGKITAQELVGLELQSVQQKLAAETAFYQAIEKLDAGNVLKVRQDQFQIVDAVKKSEAEIVEIKKQALSQQERDQKKYQHVVEGAMTSQVNAMLFQHQTLRAAMANIAESITETWIANEIRTVIFHDGAEASKTAATVAGNAARVAADTAGQGESLLVQGAAAVKWIMTEAAKAAAGAFNAMVSIPYIGPFVAVGASIAAFAAVSKLVGSVASAERGWERVPADGMQTMLHEDEMVLPKHVADPIRNMARSGGNGAGGMSVHIHANDARSFRDYLKRNPAALKAALAHAGRNGW
jgi:phage-related minor tail protein